MTGRQSLSGCKDSASTQMAITLVRRVSLTVLIVLDNPLGDSSILWQPSMRQHGSSAALPAKAGKSTAIIHSCGRVVLWASL